MKETHVMPLPPRRRRPRAVLLATLAVLGGAAPAAHASDQVQDCEMPELERVFERWGDKNHYFLADGGGFESMRWDHKGRGGLVDENEPFGLAGPGHGKSLHVEDGRVTSTPFCVSASMPHLRFMAKAAGDDKLEVRVELRDETGHKTGSSKVSVVPEDHGDWAPSVYVSLDTHEMAPGEMALATVSFKAKDPWLVDAVFIDPYARR